MSARNRELFALVPVALLLTAGFTAVFAQDRAQLGNLSLIYGALFPGALPRHAISICGSVSPTPIPTCSRWSRC